MDKELLIKWGKDLEDKSPKDIIEFAIKNITGDVIFLSAFGPEGCAIFEMIHQLVKEKKLPEEALSKSTFAIDPESRFSIANLDTGYQFKETIELKDKLEAKYNFKINMFEPELTVQEQDEKYLKDLYKKHPDQCCYMRKVLPLEKLLSNKTAWMTAIRRDQTEQRANAQAIEFDPKFGIAKINPLIKWTKSDVWKFVHEYKVPYNPLLDQGYDSIGCEPCTQPGEGRSGRWAGLDKIECGLHVQEEQKFEQELREGENI